MNYLRFVPAVTRLVCVLGTVSLPLALPSSASAAASESSTVSGQTWTGSRGIRKTTTEIMAEAAVAAPRTHIYIKREFEIPGREHRPQDPNAPAQSSMAASSSRPAVARSATTNISQPPRYPQVVGTNFNGVTGPTETNAFPPDSMGAVGPSQFVVFVNGRLRTFNKATGTADGVLNVSPDDFFSSVVTPEVPPGLNFTTDPQIRFDRLSGRWILVIIDVPSSDSNNIGDTPNRVLIAVSDAASAGVISNTTVWTFFFVQQNTLGMANTGEFLDYESLGVDKNALYIGGNMFSAATGSFVTTSAFVVKKSSILSNGPIVATAFRDLITGGIDGPLSPRGVDNYDPSSTEGYIIGPSAEAFGRLILRRVSDPGGTPAISGNIPIIVPTTSEPITVDHLGNTSSSNGRLDALDDRLYAAHIRGGKLWTAHNIAVTAAGVASDVDVQRRNGARWYQLDVPAGVGTPTVVQSGTVFDSIATAAQARQFWIPSIMVSGQGHAAMGYSIAGTPYRVDAGTSGRLVGDSLGALSTPTIFTASSTAYNPPGDPGGSFGRRWGDYSFTSVDPNDDMTMWTVQEYCNGANTYGVRVAKLFAPPPATPAVASSNAPTGQASTSVTITGISVSGSGFFDPGVGFTNRIGASVTGGVVVNSVTYVDPTHVMLDLNTVAASDGARDVTVTNPDGQSQTGPGILGVGSATPSPSPNPTATPSPTPLPTPGGTNGPGMIISPVPGSALPSSTVTFTWSAGSATAFWLRVGDQRVTEPGGSNILSSGQTGGHFWTVSNIPTDGRPIFVRLSSLVGGQWIQQDYTYTAPALAVLTPVISPKGGSYKKKVTVSIGCATPGAQIRYTLDGSDPTAGSPLYTASFTRSGKQTFTVKARAFKAGVPDSVVAAATYKITK